MNFYIISAERFNLSKEENAKRTMAMVATLLHEGADFIACQGVYKGTAERSFMVVDGGLQTARLIERLAKAYEQDSVLEVRDQNVLEVRDHNVLEVRDPNVLDVLDPNMLEVLDPKATLVYYDGETKPEYLGRFGPHDGDVDGLEAYTKVGPDVFVVTK